MKNYEKPNFEITSYEACDIVTLSAKTDLTSTGVQTSFKDITF